MKIKCKNTRTICETETINYDKEVFIYTNFPVDDAIEYKYTIKVVKYD